MTGPQGQVGLQGPQGPPGAIGPIGPAGITGPAGATGARGEPGPQGIQGERGIQGLQGEQGEVGVTGPRGANGTSVTILGSYDTVEQLEEAHPTGNPGDSYLIDGDLYVWDETNQAWVNVGHIKGPVGPRGPTGPVAALVPFSVGKHGVYLESNAQGEPSMIVFSGFSPGYSSGSYLQEGEWSSRSITVREGTYYPTSFIMTFAGAVKKLYVLFSTTNEVTPEAGVTIRPFACLAVSDSDDHTFRILTETIVYADPYTGGMSYPMHTIRRGSRDDLNVAIPEGAVVAIVAGFVSEGTTEAQSMSFSINGGLYLA